MSRIKEYLSYIKEHLIKHPYTAFLTSAHKHTSACTHTYTHIHTERERERQTDRQTDRQTHTHTHTS